MKDLMAYDYIIKKLRKFFSGENYFIEVPAQSRLSILAACEDPSTVTNFNIGGLNWPLPQTGQMWLEYELLKNSNLRGVFCVTTSYRNEANPVPGRHDRIFPMFEFESKGNIKDLENLERELLRYLGFDAPINVFYEDACRMYGASSIEAAQEERLCADHKGSIMLHDFPQRTHPFWNMKHAGDGVYNKIDVLLCGMETIGSAERSCNVDEMKENFLRISDGKYAELLFNLFGKERVLTELDNYLSLKMFPRYGGGIGVTRLARAMKEKGLLD